MYRKTRSKAERLFFSFSIIICKTATAQVLQSGPVFSGTFINLIHSYRCYFIYSDMKYVYIEKRTCVLYRKFVKTFQEMTVPAFLFKILMTPTQTNTFSPFFFFSLFLYCLSSYIF